MLLNWLGTDNQNVPELAQLIVDVLNGEDGIPQMRKDIAAYQGEPQSQPEPVIVHEYGRFKILSNGQCMYRFDSGQTSVISNLPHHVIKAFNDHKKCVIRWSPEDVKGRASSQGIQLTDDECAKIIQTMDKRHDYCHGISWETIDVYVDDLVEEKKDATDTTQRTPVSDCVTESNT